MNDVNPAPTSLPDAAEPSGHAPPASQFLLPLPASGGGVGGVVCVAAAKPLPPNPPLRSGEGGANPRRPRGNCPYINEAKRGRRESETDGADRVLASLRAPRSAPS